MSDHILVCEHITDGKKQPDVLFIENGNVHYALCEPCAALVDDAAVAGDADKAASLLTPRCTEHCGALLHLASKLPQLDGFWVNTPDDGWQRQPDEAVA